MKPVGALLRRLDWDEGDEGGRTWLNERFSAHGQRASTWKNGLHLRSKGKVSDSG